MWNNNKEVHNIDQDQREHHDEQGWRGRPHIYQPYDQLRENTSEVI